MKKKTTKKTMAKTARTKASKTKAGQRAANDALNIAAIHLLALQIEQVATEVYVTDPDRFEDVLAMMREQVGALRGSTPTRFSDNDDECPEGWILCDGLCMPMCMA